MYVALAALNAVDALGASAKPALARLEALPKQMEGLEPRLRSYVPRIAEDIVAKLKA
jgi:hypothetical protein